MREEETRLITARVGADQTTVRQPLPDQAQRDEARQQPLYDLLPGDPDRLGEFRCLHRLKPGLEPVNADKPTPLLGTAVDPGPGAGGAPAFVVLKVLTGRPTPDGQIRLREEQAWSASQGVLRGHGADADVSWVAREFYQGVSLDQLLGQPDWTRARSTSAARMILVGIAQVHARAEIHCDVKPGNVIVNGRRTTLIDFESSRSGTEHPLFGGVKGGRPPSGEYRPRVVEATKAYASPEQLFGGGPDRPILGGTDLFSWGLTVAQMFAPGHHPYCVNGFDESALAAIDRAVGAGFAAPAPDLAALPPGGLRDAVARALAWHPGARGTAADLLAQLGETGTDTEVLVGATRVLGAPVLAGLEEPPRPRTRLGRYATPAGVLGDERVGWEQRVAYAGGAVLVAFAAALVTLILLGMIFA